MPDDELMNRINQLETLVDTLQQSLASLMGTVTNEGYLRIILDGRVTTLESSVGNITGGPGAYATQEELKAVNDKLADLVTLPTGAIIKWSGHPLPNGWQICDGKKGRPWMFVSDVAAQSPVQPSYIIKL